MAKLRISLSKISGKDIPDDQKKSITVVFKHPGENSPADKLASMFEWAREQADQGTGVTITARNNDGEERSFYIDGDGADRIIDITGA